MHCSNKIFATCTILLLTCNAAIAENWVDVSNNKQILLDTDSINRNSNGIYYTVRYYEEKIKDEIVVTIQSKNNMTGIISTCKYSEYLKNKNLANTNTFEEAKSLKNLKSTSPLYNANIEANALMGNKLSQSPVLSPKSSIKPTGSTGYQNSGSRSSDTVNNNAGIEPDFGPYMRDLQRRIKMNWDPPKGNESKRVVVLFSIAKDGRLLNYRIYQSSGLPKADEAALKAVRLTAPFRPLPSEFKGESIDIQFTFDYNVLGASK